MHGSVLVFYLNVLYSHRYRKANVVPISGASTHTQALNSPVLRHGRSLYLSSEVHQVKVDSLFMAPPPPQDSFFFFSVLAFPSLFHIKLPGCSQYSLALASSTSMEDIPGLEEVWLVATQPVSSSSSEKPPQRSTVTAAYLPHVSVLAVAVVITTVAKCEVTQSSVTSHRVGVGRRSGMGAGSNKQRTVSYLKLVKWRTKLK